MMMSSFPTSMNTHPFIPNDVKTEQAAPYPTTIQPQWQEAAEAKGFEVIGRIRDRYHLALRCHSCGHVHVSRIFTLMSAQPLCPACIETGWRRDAVAAGLIHLRRDPGHRHYSIYRASCGHEIRRQHEMIKRIASGAVSLRCETCHDQRERQEARNCGWRLVGPDPQGDPNYRVYRHADGCGAQQRIARANMQTGRFECGNCGPGWAAAPNAIYLMRFTLASSRDVIKLGHARDPEMRLRNQLLISRNMPGKVIRSVSMPSGRTALREEQGMHAVLRDAHPDAVIPPDRYRGQIRVGSEIYDAHLTRIVLAMLDELARRYPGD